LVPFGGDLLVGNFSFAASEINAFDPITGAFVGSIPINVGGNTPGGLWGLSFGNGVTGDINTLYFADGINGEANGLFGAISFAIFIFAALLSLRKKIPLWRIGTVQRWLRAHIWLTLLTIPLVILHSGFRLGGPMTTLLMLLYAIVMISGIYGLILQHQMPALMKERLPAETVVEHDVKVTLLAERWDPRDAGLMW